MEDRTLIEKLKSTECGPKCEFWPTCSSGDTECAFFTLSAEAISRLLDRAERAEKERGTARAALGNLRTYGSGGQVSMERVTYWCGNSDGTGEWRANVNGAEVSGPHVDLLGRYEDTCLTPEAIEAMQDAFGRGLTLRSSSAERLEIVGDIPTEELRELAEARRNGAALVVHSSWESDGYGGIFCKRCGKRPPLLVKTDFCPRCGAKMDEGGERQ